MVESKGWSWDKAEKSTWLEPSEESYYFANKWKRENCRSVLDLGCGLGRHAILFAQNGFEVSACDISGEAIAYLEDWQKREGLQIPCERCDMLKLTYADHSFDCIWSYHVISHTDTEGIHRIINEIKRVLKPGGRIFFTLCSKEAWSYRDAGYPVIDENTVLKTHGPEEGIPHFFVNLEDILKLFGDFSFERIRMIDDCYYRDEIHSGRHYYCSAMLK